MELSNFEIISATGLAMAPLLTIIRFLYIRTNGIKNLKVEDFAFEIFSGREYSSFGEMELFYNKDKVDGLDLLRVTVTNNGHKSISQEDYVKPLTIEVGKESRIMGAKLIYVYPKDLEIELNFNESKLEITPTLLNPDDKFQFQVLAENYSSKTRFITARIKDVKKLNNYERGNMFAVFGVLGILGCFIGLVILLSIGFYSKHILEIEPDPEILNSPAFIFFAIFLPMALFGVAGTKYYEWKDKQRTKNLHYINSDLQD